MRHAYDVVNSGEGTHTSLFFWFLRRLLLRYPLIFCELDPRDSLYNCMFCLMMPLLTDLKLLLSNLISKSSGLTLSIISADRTHGQLFYFRSPTAPKLDM